MLKKKKVPLSINDSKELSAGGGGGEKEGKNERCSGQRAEGGGSSECLGQEAPVVTGRLPI